MGMLIDIMRCGKSRINIIRRCRGMKSAEEAEAAGEYVSREGNMGCAGKVIDTTCNAVASVCTIL